MMRMGHPNTATTTTTTVLQSSHQLMSEEEAHLLGGIWATLMVSQNSGRLDAAGMEPDEINRMMNDLYKIVSVVVHGVFIDASEKLV